MDNIIDFCTELAKKMIVSGANLERVQVALEKISRAYHLKDTSIYLQCNLISMAGRLPDGEYVFRQVDIPDPDIHLSRLSALNKVCYQVIREKPEGKKLESMLKDSTAGKEYSTLSIRIAQILGLSCVCMMFGGGLREVLSSMFVIAFLQQIQRLMSKPNIEQVVVNAVMLFAGTVLAYLLDTDFGLEIPVVLITLSIMVIPGIPMVNAVRNLLCGNEQNGNMQILKIVIETMAMAGGLYLGLSLFSLHGEVKDAVLSGPTNPLILIVLSFLVSVFTGYTFRIASGDLVLAGIGGAISRIMLIQLTLVFDNPLAYTALAAFVAALYAEFLAGKRKDPSTYFIYPAILPMIPGGSFYLAVLGLYQNNIRMFTANARECILSLFGMSIGFVISSIVAHYWRKMQSVHITAG